MSHGRAITFGQLERELAARSRPAVYGNPAAVRPGDLPDDVEADPEADQVGARLGLDPGEPLEKLAVVLRIDPESVIENPDPPAAVRAPDGDVDPPGWAGAETHRVVEQFPDREVQPVVVSAHRRGQHLQAEVDREVGKATLLLLD